MYSSRLGRKNIFELQKIYLNQEFSHYLYHHGFWQTIRTSVISHIPSLKRIFHYECELEFALLKLRWMESYVEKCNQIGVSFCYYFTVKDMCGCESTSRFVDAFIVMYVVKGANFKCTHNFHLWNLKLFLDIFILWTSIRQKYEKIRWEKNFLGSIFLMSWGANIQKSLFFLNFCTTKSVPLNHILLWWLYSLILNVTAGKRRISKPSVYCPCEVEMYNLRSKYAALQIWHSNDANMFCAYHLSFFSKYSGYFIQILRCLCTRKLEKDTKIKLKIVLESKLHCRRLVFQLFQYRLVAIPMWVWKPPQK